MQRQVVRAKIQLKTQLNSINSINFFRNEIQLLLYSAYVHEFSCNIQNPDIMYLMKLQGPSG